MKKKDKIAREQEEVSLKVFFAIQIYCKKINYNIYDSRTDVSAYTKSPSTGFITRKGPNDVTHTYVDNLM